MVYKRYQAAGLSPATKLGQREMGRGIHAQRPTNS